MHETILNTPLGVRQLSQEIIKESTELLVINSVVLERELKRDLESYRNSFSNIPTLFGQENLELNTELGLWMFFNSVNICFKDSEKGLEYKLETTAGEEYGKLTQHGENNSLYLGRERAVRIAGLASFLIAHGSKNPTDFLELTGFDTQPLLNALGNSGYFKDRFMKRQQLAIHNLNQVLVARGSGQIANIDTLTVMADYRIPQLLYNSGVVELSKRLEARLLSQEPLLENSEEELALRASAVVAGKRLSQKMKLPESEIDGLLWGLTKKKEKNGDLPIPHMLVATDRY